MHRPKSTRSFIHLIKTHLLLEETADHFLYVSSGEKIHGSGRSEKLYNYIRCSSICIWCLMLSVLSCREIARLGIFPRCHLSATVPSHSQELTGGICAAREEKKLWLWLLGVSEKNSKHTRLIFVNVLNIFKMHFF